MERASYPVFPQLSSNILHLSSVSRWSRRRGLACSVLLMFKLVAGLGLARLVLLAVGLALARPTLLGPVAASLTLVAASLARLA